MTFHDYMYEWLETYIKGNVSSGTYKIYEKHKTIYFTSLWVYEAKDLTRIRYQKFINKLLENLTKKLLKPFMLPYIKR